VYLITGGFGAIGREVARYLAGAVRPKLVLVSRTSLPDRVMWQKHIALHGRDDKVSRAIRDVQALEETGAQVLVARADVASEVQMRDVVALARRRFGQIDGVVHAAGVAGGGVMQLRDPAAAAAVMRPKVQGTRVLEQVLAEERLDFMVLCSSLTGITGGVGQVDYCAANAYLDAFARYQTVRGTLTISIDWDAWRDAGMAAEAQLPRDLARERERKLAHGLTAAEGIDVFCRCLNGASPQVLVSTAGWFQRGGEERQGGKSVPPPVATVVEAPLNPRPTLAAAYEPPSDEVQRTICEAWQEALGIDLIGVHDSFFDLGGHSLHAIQLVARLNAEFGTSIPVARLYEGLTPAFFAGVVREARHEARVEDPSPVDRQDRLTKQKRHQERRRVAKTGQGRLR
jgi:NAD(P)-dependent dehydrogenase (short-subunit alcohol dehydrogenase family)/acyl carrier protein